MAAFIRPVLAAALLLAPLSSAPALSAGGSSDQPASTCKSGEVLDKKTGKCVQAKSGIDDESLFETGRALAYAGRYDEAIAILELAADKEDPRILNMLGYSNRKAGRILVGLGYYEEALRIDPNFVLTREYLGEAHLQMGDVASAREQLGEIAKRKGEACAEYASLARQIADYEKRAG